MQAIDVGALSLFTATAVALLGSPGPVIALLVAVGQVAKPRVGFRFYCGTQIGLSAAATLSCVGLASVLSLTSTTTQWLTYASSAYLIWIAYRIATSPVGSGADVGANLLKSPLVTGVVVGAGNPKAYLAFASLFASQAIVGEGGSADSGFKLFLIIAVMVVVDVAWLLIGFALGRAALPPKAERWLNIILGASVALSVAAGVK
ncbi:LysE family translocator [Aquabacterium humicola]|uniref:LysE family translocator n=1 Tax=Aquabacterium humicola TaxID=3237377 RepID=UPI002542F5CA|nr:LysE family transporter [Rubrivivax pictus]